MRSPKVLHYIGLLFATSALSLWMLFARHQRQQRTRREKVIVVGGGVAGLSAAQALRKSSRADVVVFEAQSRLGGRVHTDHSLGVPVELGAIWIHRAEHNLVTALADKFGCRRFVTENRRLALYDDASGRRVDDAEVQQAYATLTQVVMPAALRRRAKLARRADDMSMAELLRRTLAVLPRRRVGTSVGGESAAASSEVAGDARSRRRRLLLEYLLYRHVGQDHACALNETSARAYDTDYYGGGGKDELLPGGYACVVDGLGRGLHVQLGRGDGCGVGRRRCACEHERWRRAQS